MMLLAPSCLTSTGSSPRKRGSLFAARTETEVPAFAGMTLWVGQSFSPGAKS